MESLVEEAASALVFFSGDPKGMLTSCRGLLQRRGDCGPAVWLAARMVVALDPHDEAIDIVEAMQCDTTGWELQDAVCGLDPNPDITVVAVGDVRGLSTLQYTCSTLKVLGPDDPSVVPSAHAVLVSSNCAGPAEALVAAEAVPVVEAARAAGTPVWLVACRGTILPEPMWRPLRERGFLSDLAGAGLVVLDLERFVTSVVTAAGPRSPSQAAAESDCPIVPELFTP